MPPGLQRRKAMDADAKAAMVVALNSAVGATEESPPPETTLDTSSLSSLAMAAASAGNAYALKATLDAGCNPDSIRDDHGNTPLLAAAQGGHTDCVMTLLRAGADIRTTNLKGQGVVHISFNHGHISLGTMLAEIENDASDGQRSNWTILLDECGVDSEAIMAAMDLSLDLNMFDTPKAPALDKFANSDLSASARFLENVSKGILSTPHEATGKDNPASTRNHRSHSKIPSLRLPGNCEEKEWSRGTGKILVPGLQLPGNVHDSMSTGEKDLVQAALEARNAEAEIFLAADLGCGQHEAHMNNKKKRAKIRSKDQYEEETPKKSAPLAQSVQRGSYISESITLIGKSQAALESEQAKMCRAQQEASDFDKEIQQQLDYSLLLAAQNGDVKSIKSWLEKGARVEAEDMATGNTALHFSALVGDKKGCKTLLREGAAFDLKNVNGQTAIDVAFCQGHTELGNYLKSKEEYLSSAVENIHDLEPENEHKSDDMSAMLCASSSVGVDFGRPEVGEDTCSMIGNKNTSHILQVSRAAQSDVRGMVKQLRSLELTTCPRDTESETGWHSTADSQDSGDEAINTSTIGSNPLALDDGNSDEFDVLKCAEEFLRTVSPAKGKGSFTDLDLLLEEADRAMTMGQGNIMMEQENEVLDEEEFDALKFLEGILKKNPMPDKTNLYKITMQEDRDEVFKRRGFELQQIRKERKKLARPRILNGSALIIVNTCEPQSDGLSTNEQFTADTLYLEKALQLFGFTFISIKRDLTRAQISTEIKEISAALCPGGNLEDSDGFLLMMMSTGGVTSIDTKPAPGESKLAVGACTYGFQEIVNLVKDIPKKPKIVILNVCGDPAERKRAQIDVPLRPTPCVPDLYQNMLDDCENVLLILNVTSGKVNWVPKGGSLFVRFFLDEMKEESINKDVAEIGLGIRNRLLNYFFARRGTGKPQCPVGRAEYDKFFLQPVLFTDGTSNCSVMLGPALKFAKELCGAQFTRQDGFELTKIDTIVLKNKVTVKYVHAFGVLLPRTCEGLKIDVENGTPNLGWQIVIHEISGGEEVFVGAAVPPRENLDAEPSNGPQRVPSTSSEAGSEGKAALKRRPSLQRRTSNASTNSSVQNIPPSGSGGIQRAPSIQRASSFDFKRAASADRPRPALDLDSVAVVGRAQNSWSVSADGRVLPDIEGHGKCAGFSAGSVIEMWHNRASRELEITVDGKHVQKVWKSDKLGELLVPAVSIGPTSMCSLEIAQFWSW